MENSANDLYSRIESYKHNLELECMTAGGNINSIKHARYYIRKLNELNIPAKDLIEKGLVNYMKTFAQRFNIFKTEADALARKWQQQIDVWLEENNLAKKWKSEHFLNASKKLIDDKSIQPLSPHLNGTWKINQRDSDSDYRQNYPSSSSQEVESPDSQKNIKKNSSFNSRSNNLHSFHRNSSSPLQIENSSSQNISSAEFNANLSIDTTEATPVNRTLESPVKPFERFLVSLRENMFRVVKLPESPSKKVKDILLDLCVETRQPKKSIPQFLREHQEFQKAEEQIQFQQALLDNAASINYAKPVNGTAEKKIDSHHLPSTSQHRSSRSSSESKQHDRKRKRTESPQPVVKDEQESSLAGKLKHRETSLDIAKTKDTKEKQPSHVRKLTYRETTQSVAEAKELKVEQQPTHDGKLKHRETPLAAVNTKKLKEEQMPSHDGKLQHRETTLSAKAKDVKEQKSTHDGKLRHKESPLKSAKAKELHDGKLKHREVAQSSKAKDIKEEYKSSRDGKLKHTSSTQQVVKGKDLKVEPHSTQVKAMKCKESSLLFPNINKMKELRVELSPLQDCKLDTKRISAVVPEARNSDKNHMKRKASPDQSAMIAITSSKKERTSVYHGGRKFEVPRLKDLAMRVLLKALKQTSDPLKYITIDASFETLEPILVQLSPEKLHKLEEEKKYLIESTDLVWKLNCDRKFKSRVHLKRENETWRAFFGRCVVESSEKLKNLTASINASASKSKPDRQVKYTSVEGPPTKRPKPDYAKCNGNSSSVKPVTNSIHPSSSRPVVPVPPKGTPNNSKPAHRTSKKDAPLMHKAKKTLGQMNRIRRS